MNPKEYMLEFSRFLKKMHDTTRAKNHDYAGEIDAFANFTAVESLGICTTEQGILTRMTDKFCRACNLLKNEAAVKDDSIHDTLLDLSIYSAILAIYLENKKND